MKLLHTSDIHYGITLGEQSFEDCHDEVNREILKACAENSIDGIIIAGDVFDRAIVNAKALAAYEKLITALNEMKIKVFIIAGNHDAPERLALLGDMLTASGVYISGLLKEEISPVSFGNADIYLIPYFNFDAVRAIYPDMEFENYQQAFSYVTSKILEKADRSKFNIAVSHCYVTGGILSESDYSARLGNALVVPAECFEGFDYTALGHLHAPHNVGKGIRYSGTPFPFSFGEVGGEKTFTVIDTESREVKTVTPSYSRTLRTVEGTYLEVLDYAQKDKNRQDFVKIILTDKYASGEIHSQLKGYYDFLLSFEGKARLDASSASALIAERLDKMSDMEILESFYSSHIEDLGDFERKWFEKAMEYAAEEATK